MAFEDLRQGRLAVVPNYFSVDLPFYRERLAGSLPNKITDIHAHAAVAAPTPPAEPGEWPDRITGGRFMSVPELLNALALLLPGKEVSPVVLAFGPREDVSRQAAYLSRELTDYPHVRGLVNSLPEWSEREMAQRVEGGGFRGIKPYLTFAPPGLAAEDVTIFDFLPHHHLRLAQERSWLVLLHIPRSRRLADPTNVRQLKEIAERYPNLRLVLAHIGRCYCPPQAEAGFAALGDAAACFHWDFSANICREAMELLIEVAGPERVLYGSDLPVTAARAYRICEGGSYINIMREADWSDTHTRLAAVEERERITFLLYEQIAAFLGAAGRRGLDSADLAAVFHGNAERLLER